MSVAWPEVEFVCLLQVPFRDVRNRSMLAMAHSTILKELSRWSLTELEPGREALQHN
jgi:hypothetical protein